MAEGFGEFHRKKRLGDLLQEEGVVTEEQVLEALKVQKEQKNGQKLGVTLVDLGYTTEKEIARALQKQLKLDGISLKTVRIPEEIVRLSDERLLRKYMMIPFAFSEKNPNILRVAMSDPLDIMAVDDISITTGFQIEQVVSTPKDIAVAIDRYYGSTEAMKVAEQYAREQKEQYGAVEREEEEDEISQAPIVRLVSQLIEQAVHKRASDIHIEPMEDRLRIRFRIDGVLWEAVSHNIGVHSAFLARLKIMGGMDISEKRKPQDGRITSVVDRMEYDIRVSVLPTIFGEKAVLRLTQKKALTRDKRQLGLEGEDLEKFDRILSHPHGIILVTGPTGSGKSTTLYTALSELNKEGVNIITVEDPVEANINGINQVQVNVKADMTFESALRSILRQDPDIIMIGEIRDSITAEIAVRASITGHLVVSTLHTNNATSTITRLQDMGIESYLIADSVIGVIAQRLVRRVCPYCSLEREATKEEKELLGVAEEESVSLREARRSECVHCGGSGYHGRIGIYEIMPVSYGIKQIISKNVSIEQIQKKALEEGMQTLRMKAAANVLKGLTTIDELKRIVCEE